MINLKSGCVLIALLLVFGCTSLFAFDIKCSIVEMGLSPTLSLIFGSHIVDCSLGKASKYLSIEFDPGNFCY